jgi:hypothetical protein
MKSFSCNIHIASWLGSFKEGDLLNISKDAVLGENGVRVIFSYPLSYEVELTLAGRVDVLAFVTFVASEYERIYKEEKETTTTPVGRAGQLLNRNKTTGKYGIWGHDLSDLYLEGAYRRRDVWHLQVGS